MTPDLDLTRDTLRTLLESQGYASHSTSDAITPARLPFGTLGAHQPDGSILLAPHVYRSLQTRARTYLEAVATLVHEALHDVGPEAYTGNDDVREVTTALVTWLVLDPFRVPAGLGDASEAYDELSFFGPFARYSWWEMVRAADAYKRLPVGSVTSPEQALLTFQRLASEAR